MHQSIGTRLDNLRRAPRCGATTRVGAPCQCPAMRGRKRCRLHGGISPGAPRGAQNGNFRDGTWTAEGICSIVQMVMSFGGKPPAMAMAISEKLAPLRIVNTYGLFAANQSHCLHGERHKGRKIEQSDGAQE